MRERAHLEEQIDARALAMGQQLHAEIVGHGIHGRDAEHVQQERRVRRPARRADDVTRRAGFRQEARRLHDAVPGGREQRELAVETGGVERARGVVEGVEEETRRDGGSGAQALRGIPRRTGKHQNGIPSSWSGSRMATPWHASQRATANRVAGCTGALAKPFSSPRFQP